MELDLDTITLHGQLSVDHPGRVLGRSVFPQLSLSPELIQGRLELSRAEFERLIRGQRDIDPYLAKKIALLVGGTVDIWLRMQAAFDLAQETDYRPGMTPRR